MITDKHQSPKNKIKKNYNNFVKRKKSMTNVLKKNQKKIDLRFLIFKKPKAL